MKQPLLFYTFSFLWHFLNALFTVEAPQTLYTVEHGNNVTMECTFPVKGELLFRDLSVTWEKNDESKKQAYALLKGKEDFHSQHSDFTGRIKLLKEYLSSGQSLLQITDVKLRDAGLYRCIIGYGGADYKTINLKVNAPYRTITQRVVNIGDGEWNLTCQSEGHPQAEVMWQNKEHEDLTDKANTSYEGGSDQLYRVTSTLTIKSRIDSANGVWWAESRRFIGTTLMVTAFFGSALLFMLCIRKARANKDNRIPVASSPITKSSNDKDTHECRDTYPEEKELKYMQIENT